MQTGNGPTELQRHMARTYFSLRLGLILLAVALPVGLPLVAASLGVQYQESLSAYYHAGGDFVRDLFVGLLFAVGAALYLYKGYSRWENRLLNAAGCCVVGVALVPMHWPDSEPSAADSLATAAVETASWHGAFAVAFFLCIAAVCLFCSGKTLPEIDDPIQRGWYKRTYAALGALMVVAPASAYLATMLVADHYTIIIVETLGVLVFGMYWLVKTIELWQSRAEQEGLTGELDLPLEPASLPSETAPKAAEGAVGARQ